jgi:hypothetical protein
MIVTEVLLGDRKTPAVPRSGGWDPIRTLPLINILSQFVGPIKSARWRNQGGRGMFAGFGRRDDPRKA